MLNILTLPKAGEAAREVEPEQLPSLLESPEPIAWVRCLAPTESDLRWLQGTFGFHPLTIEDCRQRNQRPKFEPYDGYAFLVLFALSWAGDALETTEIHCFLTSHCLITVEDLDSPPITPVWQRMHQSPDLMQRGVDFVLYEVADAVVDTYFELIDSLEDRIDEIEERIFAPQPESVQALIFRRRNSLIAIRRAIGPMREVFNALLNRHLPLIHESHLLYFRDLYDHTVRIYELLEAERERLSNALEVHLSHISNTLNQVMKRLTAVATIFMPLTFLSGVFGMNFEHLPFQSSWALALALLSMAIIPGAMWLWMQRARWF
ncbi:MAG TPA: magnesium/cobalt transporter CorA [Candidatus Tectomicrobia bacterium]|nr:magnesium/cobalt transporter CorA [Candidatus Tectomicrobia bacterium]